MDFLKKYLKKSHYFIDIRTFRAIIKTVQNQSFFQELKNSTDEALLARCAEDPNAEEALISRYTQLVRSCARPLYLTGGDRDDLVQEGMIGLLHAIRSYVPESGTPFGAYAAICIRSKLISAVRAAAAGKHSPLNESVSFQSVVPDDCLQGNVEEDPEHILIHREGFDEFMEALKQKLSRFEGQVLALYLDGLSYRLISARLKSTEKAVDNAVQRIRKKAHKIIGENGSSV